MTRAGKYAIAAGLFVLAVAIMHAEGSYQRDPGIGFGLALGLLLGRLLSCRCAVDSETKTLRAVLRERDRLLAKLAANDRALTLALRTWSDSRPGCRGGIATEAGARFLLKQGGVL